MHFNSNIGFVVSQCLRIQGIKISRKSLSEKLESHPDYPNMLSISDSLEDFGVSCQVYQLQPSSVDFHQLQYPFIAHMPDGAGRYLVIEEIKHGKLYCSDQQKARKEVSIESFCKEWDGILMYLQGDNTSGEENYLFRELQGYIERKSEYGLIAVLMVTFFCLADWSQPITYVAMLIITLLGVFVSILLLIQSIDSSNPFIQNLCHWAKKSNCNSLLNTSASKVFSWLTWSEVGFFYFAGSLLCLIFVPELHGLIAFFNILALPYTAYSLTYQYRHKSWCVLCCSVQGILILQFLCTLFYIPGKFPSLALLKEAQESFDYRQLLSVTVGYSIPVVSWMVFKPVWKASVQLRPMKSAFNRLKYNFDLFEALLRNEEVNEPEEELGGVYLGEDKAETTITIVSNPYCAPCARAHKNLDECLQNRMDLRIRVLFATSADPQDPRMKVAAHFLALQKHGDQQMTHEALCSWYQSSQRDFANWEKQFPIDYGGDENDLLKKQKEWCERSKIAATPTVFINGRRLPATYSIEDLKYFLN